MTPREYRASELGGCVKMQAALQLGYKPLAPPAWLQRAFDRGNEHEEECVAALTARGGYTVTDQQFEVRLELVGASVPGHLDGKITNSGTLAETRVLEMKAPGAYAKFEHAYKTDTWTDPLAIRYSYQLSAYQHATGLEALVACVDEGTVRSFVVEVPILPLVVLAERVALLEALVNADTLPDCDMAQDAGCVVAYLHTDTKPDRTVITDEEVIDAASQYQAITAHESQLKLRKKTLRAIMDEACDTVGDYTAGDVDITVYARKNPAKLDEDAMKRDGIDVESYRKSDGESVAMKVTPKKG